MGKRKYIYIGQMPEIGGYGISVASFDEKDAMKILRKEYLDWKKHRYMDMTFKQALEYFGGGVSKIELNKGYYDDFKE
jgi:hypothetical protein